MIFRFNVKNGTLGHFLWYCFQMNITWWHHQMETLSTLLAICAGNSPVTGEFPRQRPVTWSFDVFFELCLNKRLRKQSWGWWFDTPSCPLWRHCNDWWILFDNKLTLAQVMAWCRQATSHYLSQSWPISILPYVSTKSQWVEIIT